MKKSQSHSVARFKYSPSPTPKSTMTALLSIFCSTSAQSHEPISCTNLVHTSLSLSGLRFSKKTHSPSALSKRTEPNPYDIINFLFSQPIRSFQLSFSSSFSSHTKDMWHVHI
ncbi:hypothetical protein HBH69_146130 [Parastagonospora nodorum]|nr:hypothetical protein HBH69_146130 [Parastagonospora nodorum]KAH6456832.1 hypothetical protein HBI57_119280 [Parastagonospora nodorum]KAH6469520.1 hypothetical protein HBI58_166870 [Parastagonospora nodorum]